MSWVLKHSCWSVPYSLPPIRLPVVVDSCFSLHTEMSSTRDQPQEPHRIFSCSVFCCLSQTTGTFPVLALSGEATVWLSMTRNVWGGLPECVLLCLQLETSASRCLNCVPVSLLHLHTWVQKQIIHQHPESIGRWDRIIKGNWIKSRVSTNN